MHNILHMLESSWVRLVTNRITDVQVFVGLEFKRSVCFIFLVIFDAFWSQSDLIVTQFYQLLKKKTFIFCSSPTGNAFKGW